MAERNTPWVDPIFDGDTDNKFELTDNGDGSVQLVHTPTILNEPTPFNSLRMNSIEDAITENTENISNEIERATQSENTIDGKIDSEIERATQSETNLEGKIDSEIERATLSETNLDGKIETISKKVDNLEGVGGYLTAYDFGKSDLTQDDLNDYAISQIPNITTKEEIFNGTHVKNLFDGHVWVLTNTQDTDPIVHEWIDDGVTVIGIATDTIAGIIRSGGDIDVDPVTGEVTISRYFAVPDYANMETINRITTNYGSWTADRSGYVKCGRTAGTGYRTLLQGNVIYRVSNSNINDESCCIVQIAENQNISMIGGNDVFCYFIPIKWILI